MLSKLFTSARTLFNPGPQIKTNRGTSVEKANTDMVTTRARGQRGKPAADEEFNSEDSILMDVPSSSRKRQRKTRGEGGARGTDRDATPASAKKQKVLAERGKEDDRPIRNTRLVVEIPVTKPPIELQAMNRKISQNAQEEDVSETESATEDNVEESPAVKETRLEISDSESDDGSEAVEEPTKPSPTPISSSTETPSKQISSEDGKSGTMRHKKHVSVASPKVSAITPKSVQPKHKRFGSEEPEVEIFSTPAERVESDDECSDDDAPEVVGTQDALKSAKSKARDAAKAVEEREAAIRKKRQERDAVLKKQAEAAGKKRKRAAEVEERAQSHASGDPVVIESKGVDEDDGEGTFTPVPVISRSNLPDMLPEEYLQDEEPEVLMDLESEQTRKTPKKMKFADLVEKKPKDRRKGSTTYRVWELQSKNLAPKSSFNARSTKEAWLKGRSGSGVSGNRKPFSSGFFKSKK